MAAPHRWVPKPLCQRQKRAVQEDFSISAHQLLAKLWKKIACSSSKGRNLCSKKPPHSCERSPKHSYPQLLVHLPGEKIVLYQSFLQHPPRRKAGEPTGPSPPGVQQHHAAFRDQHPQGLLWHGALV